MLAINCSLNQGFYLNKAKIATVIPLDKGKPNKYEILNYRPVSFWIPSPKFTKK